MANTLPYVGETIYTTTTKDTHTLYGPKELVGLAIEEYTKCQVNGESCMKGSFGSVHKVSVGPKEYYVKYMHFADNIRKRKINIYNEIGTAIQLTRSIPMYVSNLMGSSIIEKESDISAYLVFEAPPGISLLEFLKSNSPLDKKNIAKYKSIYCSLHAAKEAIHSAGFVHRDIKPANIFVVHERSGIYKCKLIDFGLTVPIGKEAATAGTPGYVSNSHFTVKRRTAKKSHNDYSVKTIWKNDFLFKEPPPDCSAASGPPLPPVNNTNTNTNSTRSSRTNRSKSKTRRNSRNREKN